MKQLTAVSSDSVGTVGTTSRRPNHKPTNTAATLSASLGITEMSLGGLGQGPPLGSGRVKKIKKEDGLEENGESKSSKRPRWDNDESSPIRNSAVGSNNSHHNIEDEPVSKDATLQHKVDGSTKSDSPTPALLDILARCQWCTKPASSPYRQKGK